MSSSEEEQDKNKEDYSMPEGIPGPPLPKPDDFDHSKKNEDEQRAKKKKKRTHPTDLHHSAKKMKDKKKGCGCFGCLFSIVLIILLVGGGVGAYLVGPFVAKGYKIETISEPSKTILTPPDEPTLYIGQEIIYETSLTGVEVAFIGNHVTLSGDFLKPVSVRAAKVIGKSSARFAEDLEVIAVEFKDEGVTLQGILSGSVIQNTK